MSTRTMLKNSQSDNLLLRHTDWGQSIMPGIAKLQGHALTSSCIELQKIKKWMSKLASHYDAAAVSAAA